MNFCLSDLVPPLRWSDASTITLLTGQPDLPDAWWRSLPMPHVLAAIGPESLGELLTEIALEHWPAAAIGDVLPALHVLDPEEADEPAVAIALDRAGSWAGLLALTSRELVDQPFIQARPVLNTLFSAVLVRVPHPHAAHPHPPVTAHAPVAAERAHVAAGAPARLPDGPAPVPVPALGTDEAEPVADGLEHVPATEEAARGPVAAEQGSEPAADEPEPEESRAGESVDGDHPEHAEHPHHGEHPDHGDLVERGELVESHESAASAAEPEVEAQPEVAAAGESEHAEAQGPEAQAAEFEAAESESSEPESAEADGPDVEDAGAEGAASYEGARQPVLDADAEPVADDAAEPEPEPVLDAADEPAPQPAAEEAAVLEAEGVGEQPEPAEAAHEDGTADSEEPAEAQEFAEAQAEAQDFAEAQGFAEADEQPAAAAGDHEDGGHEDGGHEDGGHEDGGLGQAEPLPELIEAAFAGLDDKSWAVAQNRVFTDEPSAVDQLAKLFAVPPAEISATEIELRARLDHWLASEEAAPYRAHLDELLRTLGPTAPKEQLIGAAAWHNVEIRALEVPAWQFVLATMSGPPEEPQVQAEPAPSAFGQLQTPPPGPPQFQAFIPVTPPAETNGGTGEHDKPYQPLKDVSQTRRCFRQPDGRWWLRIDVTAEQLAGGECALPTGFASYLGLSPGESRTVRSAAGELTMVWHGRPVLESIERLLVDVGAREGGHLFLTLSDEGVLRARHLPVAAQGAEKITKALRLVGYTAPGGTRDQAARVIATRIGMTGPVSLPDLLNRLRERGDRDLLALLD
ncbi:hypothetical protein GCM10022419_067860 [Nonomuraea rosea]|uniref:Uncharacterized protein n=1 Tax=Nonomuraea rosea TaxID=638574 RepID=A0ABP6Y3W3_9ACTN